MRRSAPALWAECSNPVAVPDRKPSSNERRENCGVPNAPSRNRPERALRGGGSALPYSADVSACSRIATHSM